MVGSSFLEYFRRGQEISKESGAETAKVVLTELISSGLHVSKGVANGLAQDVLAGNDTSFAKFDQTNSSLTLEKAHRDLLQSQANLMMKTLQILPGLKFLAKGEHELVIYGPASVVIKDREDEIITGPSLKEALPQLFKRARFSLQHLDILVGEILPSFKDGDKIYESTVRPVTKEDIEMFPKLKDANVKVGDQSLFVVGKVWGDTHFCEEVQDQINKGELSSFSVSGQAIAESRKVHCEGYSCKLVNEISKIDLSAVTICRQGMNPAAGFVVINKIGLDTLMKAAKCPENCMCKMCGGEKMEKAPSGFPGTTSGACMACGGGLTASGAGKKCKQCGSYQGKAEAVLHRILNPDPLEKALDQILKTGEWVPHQGKRGGMGARNIRSNEIVYGPQAQMLLQGGGGSRGASTTFEPQTEEDWGQWTGWEGEGSPPYGDPIDLMAADSGRGPPEERRVGGTTVDDYLEEQANLDDIGPAEFPISPEKTGAGATVDDYLAGDNLESPGSQDAAAAGEEDEFLDEIEQRYESQPYRPGEGTTGGIVTSPHGTGPEGPISQEDSEENDAYNQQGQDQNAEEDPDPNVPPPISDMALPEDELEEEYERRHPTPEGFDEPEGDLPYPDRQVPGSMAQGLEGPKDQYGDPYPESGGERGWEEPQTPRLTGTFTPPMPGDTDDPRNNFTDPFYAQMQGIDNIRQDPYLAGVARDAMNDVKNVGIQMGMEEADLMDIVYHVVEAVGNAGSGKEPEEYGAAFEKGLQSYLIDYGATLDPVQLRNAKRLLAAGKTIITQHALDRAQRENMTKSSPEEVLNRILKKIPPEESEEKGLPIGYPKMPSQALPASLNYSPASSLKKPKENREYYNYPAGSDRGKDSANEESSRGTQPHGVFEKQMFMLTSVIKGPFPKPVIPKIPKQGGTGQTPAKPAAPQPSVGASGPKSGGSNEKPKLGFNQQQKKPSLAGEALGTGASTATQVGHTAIGAGAPQTASGAGAQQAAHQALGAMTRRKGEPVQKVIGAVLGGLGAAGSALAAGAGQVAQGAMAGAKGGEQKKMPEEEPVLSDDEKVQKPHTVKGPHSEKMTTLLTQLVQKGHSAVDAHRIAYALLGDPFAKTFRSNYSRNCVECFAVIKDYDDPDTYFYVVNKALNVGVIHEGYLENRDGIRFKKEYPMYQDAFKLLSPPVKAGEGSGTEKVIA